MSHGTTTPVSPSTPDASTEERHRQHLCTLSLGPLLLVTVMTFLLSLPRSSSAFRHSSQGGSSGGRDHRRTPSPPSSSSSSSRSTRSHSQRAKRAVARSASKIHSFGYRAAERAAESVERTKRTYWDEMVPPFGLDGERGAGLALEELIRSGDGSDALGGASGRGGGKKAKKKRRRKKGVLYRSLKMKLSSSLKKREDSSVDEKEGGLSGEELHLRSHSDDESSHGSYETDFEEEEEEGTESITHFCFLVHGHRGLSKDLWYLESVLNDAAARRLRPREEEEDAKEDGEGGGASSGMRKSGSEYGSMGDLGGEEEASLTKDGTQPRGKENAGDVLKHNVLVHNVVCNEGRTHDGVVAGGERVAEEMLRVIRSEVERKRGRSRRRALVEGRIRRRVEAAKKGAEDGGGEAKDDRGAEKQGEVEGDDDGIVDVTISMVGNSLGGLYSRYAIARIAQMSQSSHSSNATASSQGMEEENSSSILIDDGRGGLIRLHYNAFYTTASPHLGTSRHTYLPLPIPLEAPIAYVLGDTGRDLFRLTPLLRDMATSDEYLGPLAMFRTRVAYANAYHTDFPVPASTAAFLHEESDYPHHLVGGGGDDGGLVAGEEDKDDRIIATLHVPPVSAAASSTTVAAAPIGTKDAVQNGQSSEQTSTEDEKKDEEEARHREELALMSSSLDSLGWKKVIVDLRSDMPLSLSMPDVSKTAAARMLRKGSEILSLRKLRVDDGGGDGDADADGNDAGADGGDAEEQSPAGFDDRAAASSSEPCPAVASGCPRTIRRTRSSLSSREVASAFSSSKGSVHLPLGHNMIVAFSRTRFSALVNRGGRPVMDRLARELVEDMVSWDGDREKEEEEERA